MTTEELRAAADQLVVLHRRFAPLFGRKEARQHARAYLRGLLLAPGRKSVEPMALACGDGLDDQRDEANQVIALQRFLTASPWNAGAVAREIQAVFAERLVPSTAGSPVGTVGILDSSRFPKKGTESVGVARQYCGRLGKQENGQGGVYRRREKLPGNGALRGTVVDQLASPHELGGVGAFVCHAGASGLEKKLPS